MSSRSYVPRHGAISERSDWGTARIATALVTTIGATAVATTALAGPAVAATTHTTVWDRVAGCESGHRWHVSTGNGYYGGVQFSSRTWAGYGGHKYAGQACGASRLEQIEVARRVLAHQGPGAWPVCGPRAGLTRSSGHATGASLPRVAGSSNSSPSSAATTHSTAPAEKSHFQASPRSSGAHSNDPAHPAGAYSSIRRTAPIHKSRAHVYRVQSGDTLNRVAGTFHVHGGWPALYRANRDHLSNPNVLHVGQYLRLP